MICRWDEWDADAAEAQPVGLSLQEPWDGFCTTAEDSPTPSDQGPHLRGVQIPQWNLALAAHRNTSDDHLKLLGESCLRPFALFLTTTLQCC